MYYNKVEICGVNTAKLKTLSDEEKRALLLRVKDGDSDARQELIDGNLRLVLSIVQRFANRRENMDDLFQVGCIGLIKAVDHFNTDLDVKFSTYAVPMNVRRRNSQMHCVQFCELSVVHPYKTNRESLFFLEKSKKMWYNRSTMNLNA